MSCLAKKTLHFDSIDAVPNYDNYFGLSSSFNASYTLNVPLQNVVKIKLLSHECAINFNNIRTSTNKTNDYVFYFTFTTSGYSNITLSATVPETNYTTISSLLTALNTAISTAIGGGYNSLLVSLSTNSNGRVVITTSGATQFSIKSNILTKQILGFETTDVWYSNSLTASGMYNLSPDSYINMVITNVGFDSSYFNLKPMSFKIPIQSATGYWNYYTAGSGFTQSIDYTGNGGFTLANLQIKVYDRFGNPLFNWYGDYSFSLEIDFLSS